MIEDHKETLNYFKKRLPIDQYNLEKECQEQPSLYEEIGEWVSEVRAVAKTKKEHLEFIKADLSLKIRKDPEKYGLSDKPTVASVDAAILVSNEYREALDEYLELNKLADEATILLSATEQRKSMIRDLVRLFIYSYYSREDVVGSKDWKSAEQAIIDMRNQRAKDHSEDQEEEVREEE